MNHLLRNSSTCLMLIALAPLAFANSDGEEAEPKELSVAPLDHVEYPKSRPEWVDPSLGFEKDAVRIVVVSGPCDTPEESAEELKLMSRAAVSTYISRLAESGGQYDFYDISDEEIEHELAVRRYSGTVMQGDSIKYEDALELCFTDEKRQEIAAAWQNVEVRDRLGAIGVMAFFGLVLLICSSAALGIVSRRIERRDRGQLAA